MTMTTCPHTRCWLCTPTLSICDARVLPLLLRAPLLRAPPPFKKNRGTCLCARALVHTKGTCLRPLFLLCTHTTHTQKKLDAAQPTTKKYNAQEGVGSRVGEGAAATPTQRRPFAPPHSSPTTQPHSTNHTVVVSLSKPRTTHAPTPHRTQKTY